MKATVTMTAPTTLATVAPPLIHQLLTLHQQAQKEQPTIRHVQLWAGHVHYSPHQPQQFLCYTQTGMRWPVFVYCVVGMIQK